MKTPEELAQTDPAAAFDRVLAGKGGCQGDCECQGDCNPVALVQAGQVKEAYEQVLAGGNSLKDALEQLKGKLKSPNAKVKDHAKKAIDATERAWATLKSAPMDTPAIEQFLADSVRVVLKNLDRLDSNSS